MAALLGFSGRSLLGGYQGLDLIDKENDPAENEKYRGTVTLPTAIKKQSAVGALDHLKNMLTAPRDIALGLRDTFSPKTRLSGVQDVSYWIPLVLGGATAGMYGGWKAGDKMVDYFRQRKIKSELENARNEFRSALESVDAEQDPNTKTAAIVGFIDKLAEHYVEKAGFNNQGVDAALEAIDTGGPAGKYMNPKLKGAYMLAAGLGALALGVKSYSQSLKGNPNYIKLQALKEFQRRSRLKPPTIQVEVGAPEEQLNLDDDTEGKV